MTILVMTTGEQGPQAARSRVHEQEEAARVLGISRATVFTRQGLPRATSSAWTRGLP